MGSERAKILIADDVPGNVRALAQGLAADYQLQVATSGRDALDAVASDPPDLILLDVGMPDPDGHEVCRRLKADPRFRHIPVIFISGHDREADELTGLQLGAVDYISKPFSLPIVRARVATQIELKRCRDLLETQSLVDGLTGVPNRRRLDQFLGQAWLACQRHMEPLSLIMLDVDHFKAYNDLCGHLAGDDCLRRIATALHEARRRPLDLLARYGGEEFVCLLADTDARGALAVADALRQRVKDLAIVHPLPAAGGCVTVSAGVATLLPARSLSAQEGLAAADAALYRAKREGRNRVCAA